MKRNRWIGLLAALMLALSLPSLFQRMGWEERSRTVAVLFDSRGLETLARETETDWLDWAQRLRQAGLTGLAVREETLERLEERGVLTWMTRSEALTDPHWQQSYPQPVRDWLPKRGKGVLAAVWEQETEAWLSERLTACEVAFTRCPDGGVTYYLIDGGAELAHLPLGIRQETAQAAEKLGLALCPVVEVPKMGNTVALARALYKEWEALECPVLLTWGDRLPGWDEDEAAALDLLEQYLRSGGALALTEVSQHGRNLPLESKEQVTERAAGALLRGYVQWDFVSQRYGALGYDDGREISFALSRAAGERNCRILWLQPMADWETGETVTQPEAYETLLTQLDGDLERYGMGMGLASPAAPVGGGLPLLLRQLLSWVTAAGTGCLCVLLLFEGSRRWRTVLAAQLLALLGGLASAGWLSATPVLVGEASFRGVKAAQIVPLLLFLALWGRRAWRKGRDSIAVFLEKAVSGKILLLSWLGAGVAVLLALVGGYYLLRTGNSGMVADWELRVRNELEERLLIRPRFKEFALGLPCLILWCRGEVRGLWEPLLGAGAVIGLTSVTNTFLHCTPLRISLLRTGVGWALGGLIGLAVLLLWREGRRLLWQRS